MHWAGSSDAPYRPGDRAWPGAAIAELPDATTLRVSARVDETERGRLAPKQPYGAVECHSRPAVHGTHRADWSACQHGFFRRLAVHAQLSSRNRSRPDGFALQAWHLRAGHGDRGSGVRRDHTSRTGDVSEIGTECGVRVAGTQFEERDSRRRHGEAGTRSWLRRASAPGNKWRCRILRRRSKSQESEVRSQKLKVKS